MAPVPVIDRSSTTERVAEALRAMLFSGELHPGEPLREISLAESFGVARSTIREAFQSLAAEGLVTRYPNRGVVVTELAARDLEEIFGARLVLESAGVRAAAAGAPVDGVVSALAAYADAVEASDGTDQARSTWAHLEFHNALVGLTGNGRLMASAHSLTADLRLGLASVERVRRNARDQVSAHRKLLRLVKSREEAAALAELERHLAAAKTSVAARVIGP